MNLLICRFFRLFLILFLTCWRWINNKCSSNLSMYSASIWIILDWRRVVISFRFKIWRLILVDILHSFDSSHCCLLFPQDMRSDLFIFRASVISLLHCLQSFCSSLFLLDFGCLQSLFISFLIKYVFFFTIWINISLSTLWTKVFFLASPFLSSLSDITYGWIIFKFGMLLALSKAIISRPLS